MENAVIELAVGRVDEPVAAAVVRNLRVLYGTRAGEQALDRSFGIDESVQDAPQEFARALLAAEYVRKTQQYEPRARVVNVEWSAMGAEGKLTPKVVIELV